MGESRNRAKRSLGVISFIFSLLTFALVVTSFIMEWYVWLPGSINRNTRLEYFSGIQQGSDQKLQWVDTKEIHLYNVFLISLVCQSFAFLALILNFFFLAAVVFVSQINFRLNLMMKLLRPKLRRGSAVLTLIEFVMFLLEITYFTSQHQSSWAADFPDRCEGSNPALCTQFKGETWGPGLSWKCILATTILVGIQFILSIFWLLV
eukprot:TRINITY_DN15161_c0_g1_i1.p1 TRINITY_DN15161_c0_g1~~TRINITY_DN15161_c0_g1_i1.p1  ORF type:complete len:206 (-),score=41.43 TRINITY_DN15161_c0_g1_i1:42-659(-)